MLRRAGLHILKAYRSPRPLIGLHLILLQEQQQAVRFYQSDQRSNERSKGQREPEKALEIAVLKKKGKDGGICYGCGAAIQKATGFEGVNVAVSEKRGGYWQEKQNTLRKSKLKNWQLCMRCRALKEEGRTNLLALAPDSKMTEVFRAEVAKIRRLEKAVVVLCIDAINCTGSLMSKIRNYVGGNPILLAVTRCDLLPTYIANNMSNDQLKDYFYTRTKDISPAGIYLCSESPDHMKKYEGIKNLANDLWEHLDGRDTYIVGSANIGKSTLTDILISGFLNRGERLQHFREHIAVRRVETLRQSRVTKSALPGTTLQNIRVPCFTDHEQALWDTPGLLLDESLRHFPIKDFHALKAMRPETIQPLELDIPEKSFAVLLFEEGDEQELPLLRLEVRLKKNDPNGGEGPVKMVWNSTLRVFKIKVVDIDEAVGAEKERHLSVRKSELERRQKEQQEEEKNRESTDRPKLTPEQRKERKEQRKRDYEESSRQEQQEIGMQEWKARQQKKKDEFYQQKRLVTLSKLSETGKLVIDGNVGMDIDIAHLGWFGVLSPRSTLFKTFAPNTGVRVSCHPSLALPNEWGRYNKPKDESDGKGEDKKKSARNRDFNMSTDSADGDYLGADFDDEFEEDDLDDDDDGLDDDDELTSMYDDDFDTVFGGDFEDGMADAVPEPKFRYVRGSKSPFDGEVETSTSKDPWEKYTGLNIGWQFDADTRYSKKKNIKDGWNPVPKDREATE